MRRIDYIKVILMGIFLLILVCLANNQVKAQAPAYTISGGKVALPKKQRSKPVFSGYLLDSDIPNDSIFIAPKSGKYFVKRVSKKTGNIWHKPLDIPVGELKTKDNG